MITQTVYIAADGSQAGPYPAPTYDSSYQVLQVWVDGEEATFSYNSSIGTVTLDVAPEVGAQVLIRATTSRDKQATFQNRVVMTEKEMNLMYDHIMRCISNIDAQINPETMVTISGSGTGFVLSTDLALAVADLEGQINGVSSRVSTLENELDERYVTPTILNQATVDLRDEIENSQKKSVVVMLSPVGIPVETGTQELLAVLVPLSFSGFELLDIRTSAVAHTGGTGTTVRLYHRSSGSDTYIGHVTFEAESLTPSTITLSPSQPTFAAGDFLVVESETSGTFEGGQVACTFGIGETP